MRSKQIPLRVAYLINRYPAVSHTFIRREIEALERRGITVMRVALRGWDDHLVDSADAIERQKTRYVLRNGVAPLLAALLRTGLTRPGSLFQAARLAYRMSRGSYRPLRIHLAYLLEACVIREWATREHISHLHAHFADNPAEIAMLASTLGDPTYSFTAHGSDIMNRPAQIGLTETVSRAAFVAAVSSFGRSQICRWIPYERWEKVFVVRCGVEADYGTSGASNLASSSRRLLCIGRLSAEKGQMVLIDAFATLTQLQEGPTLVLVGDGPMRSAIQDLVERRGLGSRVSMPGFLDSDAIKVELRGARALVVPSLSEGLPVVIMEAMAMGRPVIAPYLAGIPELVTDGKTGWLFAAGDVSALAAAIDTCMATPDAALDAMGRAAAAAVREHHDVDREAAVLKTLFEKSVGREPA